MRVRRSVWCFGPVYIYFFMKHTYNCKLVFVFLLLKSLFPRMVCDSDALAYSNYTKYHSCIMAENHGGIIVLCRSEKKCLRIIAVLCTELFDLLSIPKCLSLQRHKRDLKPFIKGERSNNSKHNYATLAGKLNLQLYSPLSSFTYNVQVVA